MNTNQQIAAPVTSSSHTQVTGELGEEDKQSLYTLGYVLYQQGKYTDALPFFLLLSLQEPNNATYYAAIAACQKMTKEYEKAINHYAVALLLQPEKIEYSVHIAECQIAAQYTQGAVDTLTQLLALQSSELPELEPWMNKAQSLLTLLETKH